MGRAEGHRAESLYGAGHSPGIRWESLPRSLARTSFARTTFRSAALLLIGAVALAGARGGEKKEAPPTALLGCDYGSEWIKMAVATQGTQSVDIVLNEQSGRKSLSAIAFPDPKSGGDPLRSFCESAMVKPHRALIYVRELLGRAHVKGGGYGPHAFPHCLTAEDARGACRVAAGAKEFLTPETVNAMMLSYARHRAEEHSGRPVPRAVVTVPPFFSQHQRRAMLSAARIAGLEPIALISDGAAAALKYALDRINFQDMGGGYRRVVFYDMGATATKVALVQYSPAAMPLQGAQHAPGGRIDVLGVSWDSTVGGAAVTDRVRGVLVKVSEKDPGKDVRAMARLRAAANKAKEVLSANKEALVSVEDLVGTYDLRTAVTREQLDEASRDLSARAVAPITELLQSLGLIVEDVAVELVRNVSLGLTLKDIDAVELVGNAWRSQPIQAALTAALGEVPLGKSLNSDEFGANGAALAGMYLDPGLIGRLRFEAWDVMPYEVSLSVDDGAGEKQHHVALQRNSPVPLIVPSGRGAGLEDVSSAGVVTVHSIRDFTAVLYYSGGPACDEHASHPPSVLDTYAITGIEAELRRGEAQGGMARVAGIDLHLVVDLYGIVSISYATLRLIITSDAPAPPPPKALSNLKFRLPSPGISTKASYISTTLDQNATQPKSAWGEGGGDKQKVEKEVLSYISVTLLEEGKVGGGLLKGNEKSTHVRALEEKDVEEGRAAVKRWEETEAKVKARLEMLNQLEGRVYALKEQCHVLLECERIGANESADMLLDLEAVGEWCEDHGHAASAEVIREKRDLLESEIGSRLHKAERKGVRFDAIGAAQELSQNVKRRLAKLERKRPWLSKDGTDSVRHGLGRVRELIQEAKTADLPDVNQEDGLVEALSGEGMHLTSLMQTLEDDISLPGLKPMHPDVSSLYGAAKEREERRVAVEAEERRRVEEQRRMALEAEAKKHSEQERRRAEEEKRRAKDVEGESKKAADSDEGQAGGGLLKNFLNKVGKKFKGG